MKQVDKRLLLKYQQNQCTPEEYRTLLKWLSTPEGQQYLATQMEEDVAQLEKNPDLALSPEIDSEGIFNHILEARAAMESQATFPSRSILDFRQWQRWAAVFIGLLMLACGYWLLNRTSMTTHRTQFGEIATITLPDQSIVTLNGNSELRYANEWHTDQPREVWLDGEAYFSVTHQRNHQKFRVHTSKQLNVEVLGTEFDVLKRGERTVVVLNSGKVRLNREEGLAEQSVTMKPGELVEFDKGPAQYARRNVNPEVYSSWISRKLIFENTSLGDMIRMLEDTYGLTVKVSDPALLNQRFTGTVPNGNLEGLLEGLSQLLDLHIVRNKEQVLFQPN